MATGTILCTGRSAGGRQAVPVLPSFIARGASTRPDHCLLSVSAVSRVLAHTVLGDVHGSDHLPLSVRFDICPVVARAPASRSAPPEPMLRLCWDPEKRMAFHWICWPKLRQLQILWTLWITPCSCLPKLCLKLRRWLVWGPGWFLAALGGRECLGLMKSAKQPHVPFVVWLLPCSRPVSFEVCFRGRNVNLQPNNTANSNSSGVRIQNTSRRPCAVA